MTTSLHDTLAAHRMAPRARLWPSTLATISFATILFVTWVYGIVLGDWTTGLEGTAFAVPQFVWGSIAVAVLLLALTVHDVRRHAGGVWRYARFAIGGVEVLLLTATLVLLFRASTLL